MQMSVYTGIKGAPHNNHAVPMTHRPQLKMYYTVSFITPKAALYVRNIPKMHSHEKHAQFILKLNALPP